MKRILFNFNSDVFIRPTFEYLPHVLQKLYLNLKGFFALNVRNNEIEILVCTIDRNVSVEFEQLCKQMRNVNIKL